MPDILIFTPPTTSEVRSPAVHGSTSYLTSHDAHLFIHRENTFVSFFYVLEQIVYGIEL